jgi:phthalate 4,5-dioxygenase
MLGVTENELLTRTGPNTDMGRYFRCFWMPIALSRELPECDGAPIKVKVLGEDLIAFRATDGRVGLVEPTCPHRGANLFFGRNEDCAIRCVYHGWKFDLEGNAIEMPNVTERCGSKPTQRGNLLKWFGLGWGQHQAPPWSYRHFLHLKLD